MGNKEKGGKRGISENKDEEKENAAWESLASKQKTYTTSKAHKLWSTASLPFAKILERIA